MSYVDTIAWVCTLPVINIGGSLFNYCIVRYLMSRLLRLRSMVVTKFLENCRKVFFSTHLAVLPSVPPSLIVI